MNINEAISHIRDSSDEDIENEVLSGDESEMIQPLSPQLHPAIKSTQEKEGDLYQKMVFLYSPERPHLRQDDQSHRIK